MDERAIIGPMDWIHVGLLVLIGISGGVFGSMMGVGGGVLVIPLLTLGMKLPMKEAIACSLIAVAATACASAASYLKLRYANVRLALLLETTTAAGAIVGAFLAVAFHARLLAGLFAGMLVYAGYSMFRNRKQEPGQPLSDGVPLHEGSPVSSLSASYHDAASGVPTRYDVRSLPLGLGASGFAGLLSGLLGIGGGVVQVPVMNLAMGVPIRAAVATSSFMIGITAIASSFVYYQKGYMDPLTAGPVFVGVLIGVQAGTRAMPRIRALYLKLFFAAVLLVVAVLMLLKAMGITR